MENRDELLGGLQIVGLEAFSSELCPHGAIRIHWCGDAGFGQYDIVIDKDGIPHGYSEHMETTNDKCFSGELLRLIHDAIVVED